MEAKYTRATHIVALAIAILAAIYPWATAARLFRNLSVQDLLLIVMFTAVVFTPALFQHLMRIYRSSYGIVAYLLIIYLLVSTLFSSDPRQSATQAVQLAFVYLLLLPCIGISMGYLHQPERYIRWLGIIYAVLFGVGFILLLMGQGRLFVFDTGNLRYAPIWQAHYQLLVMLGAYGLAVYVEGGIGLLGAMAWVSGTLLMIMITGSRTSIFALFTALGLVLYLRLRRKELSYTIFGLGIASIGGFLLFSEQIIEKLHLSYRISRQLFDFTYRLFLIQDAVSALSSNGKYLLIGKGLGTFTDSFGNRVHNVFVQHAVETGLVGSLLVLALILLPLIKAWDDRNPRVVMGMIIYASQLTFYIGSGVTTERPFYVPLAIGLGLMWRESFKELSTGEATTPYRSAPDETATPNYVWRK